MADFQPRYTARAAFSGGNYGALVLDALPTAGVSAQIAPFFKGDRGDAGGPPGPPGPPGPSGAAGLPGGTAFAATAGEALGGHRCVRLDAAGMAFYSDCSVPTHFGRLAGITQGAAAAGDSTTITNSGVMVEPSWAWTADAPVFLGHTGLLTQTAPIGFQQVVGVALSATALFINPREPVITT